MGLPPSYNSREAVKHLPSEIKLCPECRYIVRARKDTPHGVVLCGRCGYVLGEVLVTYPEGSNRPTYSFKEVDNMGEVAISEVPRCYDVSDRELLAECNTISYPEGKDKPEVNQQFKGIKRLMEQYDNQNISSDDKKAYRLGRYTQYVGVVNTEFMMSKYQKSRAKHIIHRIGNFKKVCKNCRYEAIVAAVCIYLMREDGRKVRIHTNKFCKDIGLTNSRYTKIIEKLLSLNL